MQISSLKPSLFGTGILLKCANNVAVFMSIYFLNVNIECFVLFSPHRNFIYLLYTRKLDKEEY